MPKRIDNADDTFLFNQGPTAGLGKIQFHGYNETYSQFDLPNIEVFKSQINALKALLVKAGPDEKQSKDIDYLLTLGELFVIVPYGHLILEAALMDGADNDLLNQMFGVFIRDFSIYAAELYGKPSNSAEQRELILGLMAAPVADTEQAEKLYREQVCSLNGAYKLAD